VVDADGPEALELCCVEGADVHREIVLGWYGGGRRDPGQDRGGHCQKR
jgi:hypothetical protein